MMFRTRRLLASMLVGGAAAASLIAITPAAHAAVPGCADTVPSFTIFADRVGAAFTLNNVLVDFDDTRCYYEGELWYAAGGNGTNYQGQYKFSRARR